MAHNGLSAQPELDLLAWSRIITDALLYGFEISYEFKVNQLKIRLVKNHRDTLLSKQRIINFDEMDSSETIDSMVRTTYYKIKLELMQKIVSFQASTGVEHIAFERERQICAEQYTPLHDSEHEHGELAQAAAAYAMPPTFSDLSQDIHRHDSRFKYWPFDDDFKPSPNDRIKELTKAGALIAAEIDRLKNVMNDV